MYRVEEAPRELKSILNPRRGPVIPVPLLEWDEYFKVMDGLFAQFGLTALAGCVTAEMRKRPVPHVFKKEETAALTSLYERRAPALLERIFSRVQAPLQPLNKQSRLGWPYFDRPKEPETKKGRLRGIFADFEHRGAAAVLANSFIIMNVRLQAESTQRARDMLFVSSKGEVYAESVRAEDRIVRTPGGGDRHASRTRLVFNMPVLNLYKQVLDTAIHNVLLANPAFHHNMYSAGGTLPVAGTFFAFDVKHFERHTASVARARAQIIGGGYGDIVREFTNAPFYCPSDDWKKAFFLWPDRAGGWSDQFASGDSAVAPLQKEAFSCLYQEFAEQQMGVSPSDSLDWVWRGGDHRLTIRNYGDDNALSGDPGALKEVFSFLKGYLHVEEELPPKFLGFLWHEGRWRLGVESYLSKTYLNERAPYTNFRKYPLFGWVEKRKVYAKYGVSALEAEVFPAENAALERAGVSWADVLIGAQKEAMLAGSAAGALRNPLWLLEKDYDMDAEEKIATGLYEGLYPEETRRMIHHLLGKQWRSILR